MTGVHPLADLAPRDVVAAAITRRMAEAATDCVYLDARALDGVPRALPDGVRGVPGRRDRPGARADPGDAGRALRVRRRASPTSTGGRRCPGCTPPARSRAPACTAPTGWRRTRCWRAWSSGARAAAGGGAPTCRATRRWPRAVVPAAACRSRGGRAVQRAMSAGAGIGRDAAGLAAASDAVEAATGVGVAGGPAGVEDAALTLLAAAVLAAAGTRTESRGCHVRTDHPDRDDAWQRASLRDGWTPTGARPIGVGSAGRCRVSAACGAVRRARSPRRARRSASPTPTTCSASSATALAEDLALRPRRHHRGHRARRRGGGRRSSRPRARRAGRVPGRRARCFDVSGRRLSRC